MAHSKSFKQVNPHESISLWTEMTVQAFSIHWNLCVDSVIKGKNKVFNIQRIPKNRP